jgi:hypothetical protein
MTKTLTDSQRAIATFEGGTPFMAFWAAINTEMAARNLPDLTFGPARDLWRQTVAQTAASQERVLFAYAA